MLNHPALSQLPCSECQKHVYTIPEATLETYEDENGEEQPILRPSPPPCDICPKKGPEFEDDYRLNWSNTLAYTLYERMQSGAYVIPPGLACDPVLADKLRDIDRIVRKFQRAEDHQALSLQLFRLLV